MVISNKRLDEITSNKVIVCDVDEKQMQSSFLLIDGILYYAVMNLNNFKYCTHKGSIEKMKKFIEDFPSECYDFYPIDYFVDNERIFKKMEEIYKIFNRDSKIEQILNG